MLSSRYYSASRLGTDAKPRTAMVLDEDDELYAGFNEVSPALDTRNLREDEAFQETLKTAGIGRKVPSRMGTGVSTYYIMQYVCSMLYFFVLNEQQTLRNIK